MPSEANTIYFKYPNMSWTNAANIDELFSKNQNLVIEEINKRLPAYYYNPSSCNRHSILHQYALSTRIVESAFGALNLFENSNIPLIFFNN